MRLDGFTVDVGGQVRVELRGQLNPDEWEQLSDLVGREVTITAKRRRWWHRG